MSRRVGIIGFMHESNTFAAKPTTLEDFSVLEKLRGVRAHLTGP